MRNAAPPRIPCSTKQDFQLLFHTVKMCGKYAKLSAAFPTTALGQPLTALATIGLISLSGCDTYTVPVDASYSRPAQAGSPPPQQDYQLRLWVSPLYVPIISRHLNSSSATIFECRSGVRFATVNGFTHDPSFGFQAHVRVKYTMPMNRMCIMMRGGRWLERFETLPAQIKPMDILF